VVNRTPALERFELEQLREPADFRRNLAIFEALAQQAVKLGVFRRADPLEGIEQVIRLARDINRV
jgi:hypothetical protein